MTSKPAVKGIYLKKANEYLKNLQQSLEQAGGLSSLWNERTARMTTPELLKLGNQLGITEEGEYSPLASISIATESVNKVFSKEHSSHINDIAYKLTGKIIGFDQQVNSVWFDYAYNIIEKEGISTIPPTAEELKAGFVNGDYDAALTERYSILRNSETDLLLSCHDLESHLSSPIIDLGPMR